MGKEVQRGEKEDRGGMSWFAMFIQWVTRNPLKSIGTVAATGAVGYGVAYLPGHETTQTGTYKYKEVIVFHTQGDTLDHCYYMDWKGSSRGFSDRMCEITDERLDNGCSYYAISNPDSVFTTQKTPEAITYGARGQNTRGIHVMLTLTDSDSLNERTWHNAIRFCKDSLETRFNIAAYIGHADADPTRRSDPQGYYEKMKRDGYYYDERPFPRRIESIGPQ